MRKIISLGLFALMLSIFSGQALAGDKAACDALRDPDSAIYAPRLFGLCVAWHNADVNGQAAIAANYSKRSGGDMVPGDYGISGGWGGTRTTKALVKKFYPDIEESRSIIQGRSTNDYPLLYVPGSHQGWDDRLMSCLSVQYQNNLRQESYQSCLRVDSSPGRCQVNGGKSWVYHLIKPFGHLCLGLSGITPNRSVNRLRHHRVEYARRSKRALLIEVL